MEVEYVDCEEDTDLPETPTSNPFNGSIRLGVARSAVSRGPWVLFSSKSVSAAGAKTIERELTLRPFGIIGGVKKMMPPVKCFEKRELGPAESMYLVPRAYFTNRFGLAAVDETSVGEAVSAGVAFEGSLRDARQREFVQRLVRTLVEDRNTIALGSAEPGCGKTVMFLYIWSVILRRKCLVIVHGLPIVAQWIAAVRKFVPSARIGIIHQDIWQIRNRDIVVASSDTLASRAADMNSSLWREFGVVCFDEAHHILANTFVKIYLGCMHARYCISLTGTPYRKDGLTHAMPFLTGPNAATMKNTDPVDVRVVEFWGGLRSTVLHRYGPAKDKPNEAAMMSAFVEDETRTRLIADMVYRSIVDHGRKALVLCARNDLREAIRLLVLERIGQHAEPPHLPLVLPAQTHTPYHAVKKRDASQVLLSRLTDVYDGMHIEGERKVASGPATRREMVEKLRMLEAKADEQCLRCAREAVGTYPKVVPELAQDPEAEPQPVPWIESLNAGDDYCTRNNKYSARAIIATYVMAREALDVPGLDTLIFATPSSDVRQAVGRIRRTGRGGSGSSGSGGGSGSGSGGAVGAGAGAAGAGGAGAAGSVSGILSTPNALVIDLVDAFAPFNRWGAVRESYYRSEGFMISKVQVRVVDESWAGVSNQ